MPDTTLRGLAGLPQQPPPLAASTLVMVDLQNTYTRGVMELEGVQAAIDQAETLLDRARTAGVPVVHVMHDGGPGSAYDVSAEIGQIVGRVAPRDGEPVVVKGFPNAFNGTGLQGRLGTKDLVLAGFMTHMCISSTARAAFDLGYRPVVVAGATATRSLPGVDGSSVSAGSLQTASLAALGDMFAVVVPSAKDVPD